MKLDMDFTLKKFVFGISALTLIIAGLMLYFLVLTDPKPDPENAVDRLALCLRDRGATMYGLPTCPHCQEQKDKFGDFFKYIDYIDCSENENKCMNQRIESVPTWIIDGQKYDDLRELDELADKAGCDYP